MPITRTRTPQRPADARRRGARRGRRRTRTRGRRPGRRRPGRAGDRTFSSVTDRSTSATGRSSWCTPAAATPAATWSYGSTTPTWCSPATWSRSRADRRRTVGTTASRWTGRPLDLVLQLIGAGTVVVPGHGAPVDRDFVRSSAPRSASSPRRSATWPAAACRQSRRWRRRDWPYPREELGDAVRRGYEQLPADRSGCRCLEAEPAVPQGADARWRQRTEPAAPTRSSTNGTTVQRWSAGPARETSGSSGEARRGTGRVASPGPRSARTEEPVASADGRSAKTGARSPWVFADHDRVAALVELVPGQPAAA